MICLLLCLERTLDERTGQVGYRYGKEAQEQERMDFLEFHARTISHIPDMGWAEMIRKVYEVDPMICLNAADNRILLFPMIIILSILGMTITKDYDWEPM